MFLTWTSYRKTTHANGYYGAWLGWAVSVCVLPLTKPESLALQVGVFFTTEPPGKPFHLA